VVVWALSTFPGGSVEESFLAQVGRWLAPVGRWMGLDWRLMGALLTSFMAKENSMATRGGLFGTEEEAGLAETLAATFSPATALAFLVTQMLFIPCVATVGVVRQETGSWRWTLFDVGFLLVISLASGVATYHLTSLFW